MVLRDYRLRAGVGSDLAGEWSDGGKAWEPAALPSPDVAALADRMDREVRDGFPLDDLKRDIRSALTRLSAEKDEAERRAEVAERERDGWSRTVAEIVGALPLGKIVPASGTVRDLVAAINEAFAKNTALQRELDQAREATVRLQDSNSKMAQEWTALLHRAEAAESKLAALQRELDQAREALRPFAAIGAISSDTARGGDEIICSPWGMRLRDKHFRHARSVLEGDGT